ncbi:unnamed protein product, partial [Prorocentrum cordatum]
VPTVLHTKMGQLAVGSASRDMLEFVSGVDIKDEDLPRETIKLEDKLDHAAGEAHLPEETVKLEDDHMPRNEFAVQAVVVQEMAMHVALVDVAVQGEVPSAGVRRSWEATVEANQLAHARAAAAAACRRAQWRLEHDELEGVAVPARSEEVQQFEELVVEGSFEVHSWPRKGSDGIATTKYIVKAGSDDIAPLTADRDLWRPGWQADGEELAPPLPSAAEVAEGRQWLRSSFRPNSPWARWASRERRRQRFKG